MGPIKIGTVFHYLRVTDTVQVIAEIIVLSHGHLFQNHRHHQGNKHDFDWQYHCCQC